MRKVRLALTASQQNSIEAKRPARQSGPKGGADSMARPIPKG